MLIRIGQFDITECWDGVLYSSARVVFVDRFGIRLGMIREDRQ